MSELLTWLGEIHFASPLRGAALLALVALAVVRIARRRPRALAWPGTAELRAAGAWRRDPLRGLSLALRAAAAVALVAALAGPTAPASWRPEALRGLDLVLVVDASGSMRALDAEIDGEWQRRLDLARSVVGRFARRRVAEGDRVGLVVFGESAFTLCPLTSDGALLAAALARVEAGMSGEATALGDALALAVKRVAAAEDPTPAAGSGPRAGRLVVLLTDGRANAGAVPTEVAAGLAATAGIRVHTVGIGTGGEVAVAGPDGARRLRLERHDLDLGALRSVAGATGGRAFTARSSADLADVYAEIDALERVERPAPPRRSGEPAPEPFLAAAGLLLLAEIGGTRVLARRLP